MGVESRGQMADDTAMRALSLQDHHDKQRLELAEDIERAVWAKQMAEEDQMQAQHELKAANEVTQAVMKGKEDIKMMRRRLQTERGRTQAAKEENTRLTEMLRNEIRLRQ